MNRRPISAAYLERKLKAITGASGDNPLPDLADLVGLLVLESDRPEWGLAGGESLYFQSQFNGGLAGEVPFIGLNNPTGSGVLAIIEAYMVGVSAGGVRWALNLGESTAGSLRGHIRDLRIGRGDPLLSINSACNTFTQTQVAGASGQGAILAQAGLIRRPITLIVPPGQNIGLVGTVAAATMDAYLEWRERPIEGLFDVK